MSGPKVVHVVTREELEATCRRWLILVDEAGDELLRKATRMGVSEAGLQERVAERRAAVEALLRAERWPELQKEAPGAIEHFRHEGERLREVAVAAAVAERSKKRRTLDAARSVIAAFAAAGKPIPQNLSDVMGRAMSATDHELDAMRVVIEAGIAALAPAPSSGRSIDIDLASRLVAGEEASTLATWVHANLKDDPQAKRLDALLAELATFPTGTATDDLAARAALVAAEPSLARRALMTDSLVLEAGRRLRAERELEAAIGRSMALRAELADHPSGRACAEALEAAIAGRDVSAMGAALAQGDALLDASRRQAAASARRRAVLGGLTSLGYEVREGMEAAWAKDGRIVVRRPGSDDYGVELAAPADASRMQARLVGSDQPSTPRTAIRDTDQEIIWCGQFDQLRSLVATGGGHMELERALAPGEQPVKTISMPRAVVTSDVEAATSSRVQSRAASSG